MANKKETDTTTEKKPRYMTFSGDLPNRVVRELDARMRTALRLPPEGFELGLDRIEKDGKRFINIDHFKISEGYRGEGHGTDLLRTIRDFFADKDVDYTLIHMKTPDAQRGRAFVRKLGFELVEDVTTDERLSARYTY